MFTTFTAFPIQLHAGFLKRGDLLSLLFIPLLKNFSSLDAQENWPVWSNLNLWDTNLIRNFKISNSSFIIISRQKEIILLFQEISPLYVIPLISFRDPFFFFFSYKSQDSLTLYPKNQRISVKRALNQHQTIHERSSIAVPFRANPAEKTKTPCIKARGGGEGGIEARVEA